MDGSSDSPEDQYLDLYNQAWGAELVEQASAVLVAGGVRLPAHREILMLRSRVLCGLLADLGPQEAPLVLEAPFQGFTAHQVALLLRFIYHPQLINTTNFAQLGQHLPALLRLAHKLDVPVLLEAITKYIIANTGCAKLKTLEQWAHVSQACQLDELHAICVCRMAAKLAAESNKKDAGAAVKTAVQAVQQLRQCDRDVLLHVVAVLAASTRGVDVLGRVQPCLLQAAAAQVHPPPVLATRQAGVLTPVATPPPSDARSHDVNGDAQVPEGEGGRSLVMQDAHVELLLQDYALRGRK
ncbi:BTB POZ domain-containing 9 [Chlorella sorokiniana]|uniref:BTB POZ domain-containing 9 n=1 Tax=Chlorella sorokiniana TaxID=3076 RepID=A0A2P6TLN7_CHLSO|nr:BTB POZ domain-containing 9 [Chlorella sorokiniana]|eukprot:PRW45185.1 BTB POZ domain-containing 9 [Chlorella sorokiniana]